MTNNDFDKRVAAAAAETRFMDRARRTIDDGRKLPGFEDAARTLIAVGLDSRDALEEIFAASSESRPEQLIAELGKSPDRAAAVANMNQTERLKELVRLDGSITRPAAPAPPPRAAATTELSDDAVRGWARSFMNKMASK